jgi:hypothetical protein
MILSDTPIQIVARATQLPDVPGFFCGVAVCSGRDSDRLVKRSLRDEFAAFEKADQPQICE